VSKDDVPHRDKRKLPAPERNKHLSPHEKPRVWTLRVRFTTTTEREMVRHFHSKHEREQARAQVERYFREEAEAQKNRPKRRFFYSSWYSSPLRNFTETEARAVKSGPVYTEEYSEAT
jgi:hypothetical protein